MKAHKILWDTSGDNRYEDSADVCLPDEADIPSHISEDEVADYLSDKYGFLVSSFELKK